MVIRHEERNPLDGRGGPGSMTDSAERAMQPAQPRFGQALTTVGDGLRLGRFTILPTGLRAEGLVSESDWRGFIKQLRPIYDSMAWILGDWAAYGERTWGKGYKELAKLSGLEEETLTTYAYVARSVQFSIRIENLSFTHHRLVAALSQDQQVEKLAHAANNKLSVMKFSAWLDGKKRTRSRRTTPQRFADKLVGIYERYRVEPLDERLLMADFLDEMALALRQEEPPPAQPPAEENTEEPQPEQPS